MIITALEKKISLYIKIKILIGKKVWVLKEFFLEKTSQGLIINLAKQMQGK